MLVPDEQGAARVWPGGCVHGRAWGGGVESVKRHGARELQQRSLYDNQGAVCMARRVCVCGWACGLCESRCGECGQGRRYRSALS